MSTIEERPETVAATAITHDYSKRMMVFGGRSSMELAAKVAGKLDVDLGQVTLKTFANGEVYCRYEESIRGADVFLVQSTCANEQSEMTPNDALVELLTMIDAAQGASAHRIIAVMWSTGTWKKPCTWPAWRSMVSTRSTPTPSRHLATMRAEIGSRGADFLSWRA